MILTTSNEKQEIMSRSTLMIKKKLNKNYYIRLLIINYIERRRNMYVVHNRKHNLLKMYNLNLK